MAIASERQELKKVQKIDGREHMAISCDRQHRTCQLSRHTFGDQAMIDAKRGCTCFLDRHRCFGITSIANDAGLLTVLALHADLVRIRHVKFLWQLAIASAEFVVGPSSVTVPLPKYEDWRLDLDCE